jgi:TusA-related sulfurtransferase
MNIKKCPHCQKEVDAKASKCPYCQSDMRSWVKKHQVGLIILAIIFVPIFMSGLTASPTTSVPVQKTAEEITFQKKNDFASLAKMNVEMMLKAPSTAKFNTSPVIKEENGTYSISSWVDSENSYGANIRIYWSAKAHYIGGDSLEETGAGANWIIDEFIFDGEKVK